MKNTYVCLFNDLVKKYNVSATISELKKIQSEISKQTNKQTKIIIMIIKDGKERKLHIVEKMIYAQEKLALYMNTFKGIRIVNKNTFLKSKN